MCCILFRNMNENFLRRKIKEGVIMKNNLTGMYKIAYNQVLNLLVKEELHPNSLTDAKKDLIQYLEDYQIKNKDLEDNDFIFNVIVKGKLYRIKRTQFFIFIRSLFICLAVFFVFNFLLDLLFNDDPYRVYVIYYISFSLYISLLSIGQSKLKYVIPLIILLMLFSVVGQYFILQLSNVSAIVLPIFCLCAAEIAHFFILIEYKDWKRNR